MKNTNKPTANNNQLDTLPSFKSDTRILDTSSEDSEFSLLTPEVVTEENLCYYENHPITNTLLAVYCETYTVMTAKSLSNILSTPAQTGKLINLEGIFLADNNYMATVEIT